MTDDDKQVMFSHALRNNRVTRTAQVQMQKWIKKWEAENGTMNGVSAEDSPAKEL